jgi:type IV pilus assembly protein PilQ
MKNLHFHIRILWVAMLGLVILLGACADKKEKDPFMEKWEKLAEDSKDKTYTHQDRKVEFSQLQVKSDAKIIDEKPKRNLPTMRVSLNFYNTDLQAVLRSMARIANQNIILSASLQAPENQGKHKVNLNVSETPWDQAFNSILNANGLSYDWDGEIIRVMTLEDMKGQNEMKKAVAEKMAQTEKQKTVEPMVTVKVQVNYADVTELEKTLKGYLASSGSAPGGAPGAAPGAPGAPAGGAAAGSDELAGKIKGLVVADRHSSSIVIQAPREHAEMLVKLVEKLDEPRLQVHLKAFIVEATKDSLQDIGFQWGGFFKSIADPSGNSAFIQSSTDRTIESDGTVTYTNTYGLGPSSRGYGFNFPAALTNSGSPPGAGLGAQGAAINFLWGNINNNILQMQLTALARDGKVSILSEPSLTTLDNSMAFTENGEKVPFVSVSQNGTNVQFIDAVLRLEMTPHVIDGRNLRMKLIIKNDEVVTDKTLWVQGNPPIRKKETNTTLIVEDGSTIIISGLAKNTKANSSQGFPGLKDVPAAGYLFGDKSKQDTKQDVLIFITPTILKGGTAIAEGPQPTSRAPQTPSGRPGSPDRQPIPLGPAPTAPQPGRPGS